MENEYFNSIEIVEQDGISVIKIDNTRLKGLLNYELKRGTDNATLTITITVPPKNLKASLNP